MKQNQGIKSESDNSSDYTKTMGLVKVIFINPDYNYYTNVSGDTTEQQARDYFVGKYFNVAPYPKEEMKKVIDIEFHPKGTYDENTMEKGGKTKNKNEIIYNGKLITKLFPSGYYEFYSDKDERFLKFDDLDDAKARIDSETKSSGGSISDYYIQDRDFFIDKKTFEVSGREGRTRYKAKSIDDAKKWIEDQYPPLWNEMSKGGLTDEKYHLKKRPDGSFGIYNKRGLFLTSRFSKEAALEYLEKANNTDEYEIYNLHPVRKSKYDIGDKVYSWQNTDYPAEVVRRYFSSWESIDKPHENDTWKYLVRLKNGQRSKWMSEPYLFKTKQKEYAEGGKINIYSKFDNDLLNHWRKQGGSPMSAYKELANLRKVGTADYAGFGIIKYDDFMDELSYNDIDILKAIKAEYNFPKLNEMERGGKIHRIPDGTTVEFNGEQYYVSSSIGNYKGGFTYKIINYETGEAHTVLGDKLIQQKDLEGFRKEKGGTIRKAKVKIEEKPYFKYVTVERELPQTIITNQGIFPKEDVIKEFYVDSRIIMERGGVVKRKKEGTKHFISRMVKHELYIGFWDESDNGYSNVYKISNEDVPADLEGEALFDFVADHGEWVNEEKGWDVLENRKSHVSMEKGGEVGKEKIVDAILDQMKRNVAFGDVTVEEELFMLLPKEKLIQSFSEDQWTKWKEKSKEEVIDHVLDNMKDHIDEGDVTVEEGLFMMIPKEDLIASLPEEKRKELGGILVAGLVGALAGAFGGYAYRDNITTTRENALKRAIEKKKNAVEALERRKAKIREYKENVKSKAIHQIQRLEKGGLTAVEFHDRMYSFMEDDLKKLEKAIKDGDKEEVERFFSYWSYHLKRLKTKTNDRMYNFLKDDLSKLEKAVSEKDNEEVDKFFSYWGRHLKSLKMTDKELDLQSFHSRANGSKTKMAEGGKTNSMKTKLQQDIKTLQDAIDNSLLDDETKAKIPAKIEAKRKKLAEIEAEETSERIERERIEKEKKLRTQSLKNKSIYIDIDARLKEKMRNAIHSEGIPYESKTEGETFRVFLSNQHQLDIVTRLYNDKREKIGLEPISKEQVANVVKQRVGKLKFMPVKVKPNLKNKLPIEKKRSVKKVEKKRSGIKGKAEDTEE